VTADTPPVDGARVAAAVDAVLRHCHAGHRPLIALDHDGTLSPIAATPDAASLAPGAAAVLHRLTRVADVAIVSGRGLADLARRFPEHDLILVAEHGLRARVPDGTVHALVPALDVTLVAELVTALTRTLAGAPGWLVEDKTVGVAVHHRLVAPRARPAMLAAVTELLGRAATATGGVLQEGKAVLELRAAGADKGEALRWLAARTGGQPVVMIGDDLTDEPALTVAAELGGVGLFVGGTEGASAATLIANRAGAATLLADPAEVVATLEGIAVALEG
jgi:trehalose 6-phosphate phosphatase